MTRCPYGLFGAHKFKPRYHVTNKALEKMIDSSNRVRITADAMISMQEREYVYDICERCGCIVDRHR